MPSPVPPALPLPDFEVIAQNHHNLAAKLSKCSNLPAFDIGRAILAELRDMREDIRAIKSTLRANDINGSARILNSHINNPDDDLHPLYNVTTGMPITNFPQTPAILAELDVLAVTAILQALGADTSGRLDTKRRRLRTYLGLRPLPV